MNSVERMREHIIQMQQWASQNSKANERLMQLLLQVRNELEKKL